MTGNINDSTPKDILIVGFGDLARRVLEKLLNSNNDYRITVGCRQPSAALPFVNLLRFAAKNLGYPANVKVCYIDLNDIDRTAETLYRLMPDVTFNAASLQSWRVITELPQAAFEALDAAQFGPWLPMHLVLMHKLMLATNRAGRTARVVNAAFPDAVNPTLSAVGLTPLCGIGNVANIIPALTYAVAYLRDADVEDIRIRLATQHFFSHFAPRYGFDGGASYRCWLEYSNGEYLREIDLETILPLLTQRFKRTGGIQGQALTAASAVSVINGLFSDSPVRAHAPGPNGLPGGYPVFLQNGVVRVDTPGTSEVSELIDVNEKCQQLDGIRAINKNGEVEFEPEHMAIMHSLLGYEHQKMTLDDAPFLAEELATKYHHFADRCHRNPSWRTTA